MSTTTPTTTKPQSTFRGLLAIWPVLSVTFIGGTLYGFGAALMPIYDTMSTEILDCARYTNSGTDCPVSTGYCITIGNECVFPHRDQCGGLSTGRELTYSECTAVDAGLGGLVAASTPTTSTDATVPYRYYSSCQWVANKCTATNEIPSGRLGMMASMITVGGLIGSSAGSQLIHLFGFRHVMLVAALVTLLAALVTHAQPFGYTTIAGMRFIFGLSTGVVCVAAPTYVDIYTPQLLRNVAGCVFQISITLGIAITSILGYIITNTDGVLTMTSLQLFLSLDTFLCIALVWVAVFCMHKDVAMVHATNHDVPSSATNTEMSMASSVGGADLDPLQSSGYHSRNQGGSGSPLTPIGGGADTTVTIDLSDILGDTGGPVTISGGRGMLMGGGSIGGSSPHVHIPFGMSPKPPLAPLSSSLSSNRQNQNPLGGSSFGASPRPPVTSFGSTPPPTTIFGMSPAAPAVDTLGHVVIMEPSAAMPQSPPPGASPLPTFFSFENTIIKQAFITVTVLILVMQFTGINAIMNYAPRIAKSVGVPPMLGNAVIMTWNFLTTLIAVPLASRIPLSKLYLLGLLVASIGCAISASGSYLAGSAGGVSTPLISFISCVGIAVFIAGFETGMAPAGFVLVARVYPSHLTGEAMGYYNAGQFMCGFIIIGFYPVLSDFISSAFYAAASGGSGSSTVTTTTLSPTTSSSAATVSDTALEAATAYASSVLFGVFAVVGVVGCYVLRKYLP